MFILLLILSIYFYYNKNIDLDEEKNIDVTLIASQQDFQKIHNQLNKKNPYVVSSYSAIEKRANEILNEEMCQYKVDEGNRMLDVSRKCKETMEILGFMVKMSENYNKDSEKTKKYLKRAIDELVNVSNFEDWHPTHFLDTAEMTYSVALGYNWLYDYLSNEEREKIENAIVQKGLIPGIMKKYANQFEEKNNNWNPICNGSLAIGAIALLNIDQNINLSENDVDYKFQKNYLNVDSKTVYNNQYTVSINNLCNAIIKRSIDKIPLVYEEMQNGGYDEGTLYWEYGNSYLVNFLSTANLTFKDTFNLVDDEIFKNTILYPVYLTGKSSNNLPKCKLYNYGDADEKIVNTSASTWLSNVYYNDKELSKIINWYQENYFENQNIYQLLWQNYDYSLNNGNDEILAKINDKYYKGTEIAILQENILDKDGFYIATKSGQNANTNHSDLDIGSFILDAKGTRWIEDEGREDYNVYGYWDKKYTRWTYYKKRAESHSTIVLKNNYNPDQKIGVKCNITNFWSGDEQSRC